VRSVLIALLDYDKNIKQIPRHHWVMILRYLAGLESFCPQRFKDVISKAGGQIL
jgi:hypothetical protein